MPDLGSGRKRTHLEFTIRCAEVQQHRQAILKSGSTTSDPHFQSLLSEDEDNTKHILVSARHVKRTLPYATEDRIGAEKALDSPDPLQAESPDALPSPLDLPKKSYSSGHASSVDHETERKQGRKRDASWDAMDRYKRTSRGGSKFGERDVKAIPIHQHRQNSMVSRFAPKPQNTLRRSIDQSQNISQNPGTQDPMRTRDDFRHQASQSYESVKREDPRKQQNDFCRMQHVQEFRHVGKTLYAKNKKGKRAAEPNPNNSNLDPPKDLTRHVGAKHEVMSTANIEDLKELSSTTNSNVVRQSPRPDNTPASPSQLSHNDRGAPASQHHDPGSKTTSMIMETLPDNPRSAKSHINHEAKQHPVQYSQRAAPEALGTPELVENGRDMQRPKSSAQQLVSLFKTNPKLATALRSESSLKGRPDSQITKIRHTENASCNPKRSTIQARGTVLEEAVSKPSDGDARQARSKKPKLAHGMQTDLSIDELSGFHEDNLPQPPKDEPVRPVNKVLQLPSKRSTRNVPSATTRPSSISGTDRDPDSTPVHMPDLNSHVAEPWSSANPWYLNKWKTELIWPPHAKVRVSVNVTDIEKLDEEQFLNDNLINFYLRFLELEYEESRKPADPSVFFFNTFFYQRLSSGASSRTINYDAVKRWTSKVDIFQYDYIVVPINEHLHWYLALICNPKKLLLKEHETGSGSPPLVCSRSTSQEQHVANTRPGSPPHNNNSDLSPTSEYLLSTKGRSSSFDVPMQNLTLFDSSAGVQDFEEKVPADGNTQARKLPYTIKDEKAVMIEDEVIPENEFQMKILDDLSRSKHKQQGKTSTPLQRAGKDYRSERIITFDSLGNPHSPACSNLRSYLSCEAKARHEVAIEAGMPKGLTAKGIPEQPNLSDCGLYLLAYVQKFLKQPSEFHQNILQSSSDIDWTGLSSSNLRKDIRDKLLDLHEEQVLRERAAKLSKSRVNQVGKNASKQPFSASSNEKSPVNLASMRATHTLEDSPAYAPEVDVTIGRHCAEAPSTRLSTASESKATVKPWESDMTETLKAFEDRNSSSGTLVDIAKRAHEGDGDPLPMVPSVVVTPTVNLKLRRGHRHNAAATSLPTTVDDPRTANSYAEESDDIDRGHSVTRDQSRTDQPIQLNLNYASSDGEEAIEIPDSRPSSPAVPHFELRESVTGSRKRRSNTYFTKSGSGKRAKDSTSTQVGDDATDIHADSRSSCSPQSGRSKDDVAKPKVGENLLLSRVDRMASGYWRHNGKSVVLD